MSTTEGEKNHTEAYEAVFEWINLVRGDLADFQVQASSAPTPMLLRMRHALAICRLKLAEGINPSLTEPRYGDEYTGPRCRSGAEHAAKQCTRRDCGPGGIFGGG